MFGLDRKAARFAWTCAVVGLVVWGVLLIHRALFVFAVAIMLAYLFHPLVDAIAGRLPWKTRTPAVAVPFVLILGSLAVFVAVIRPQVRQETELLREQARRGQLSDMLTRWTPFGIPIGKQIAKSYDPQRMQRDLMEVLPQLRGTLSVTARGLTDLFIIPILSFLLLRDGPRIREALLDSLVCDDGSCARRARRAQIEGILEDAHILILQHMRTLLLLALTTLGSFTIAFELLRVKYAVLLALLAFPMEFVPIVGPLTAGLAILAVCDITEYPHLWWIVCFLIAFRLVQDYVLGPHLMRRGVKLHPLLVMFAIFAGGEIRGIAGIVLSVPILAILRLLFYEWRKGTVTPFAKFGDRAIGTECSMVDRQNLEVSNAK